MQYRYVAVPWLEQSDLEPMGDPEATIERPGDITLGLVISHPFGHDTDAMLEIRAQDTSDKGGIITMAISAVVMKQQKPTNLQSNPRRALDANWWKDED